MASIRITRGTVESRYKESRFMQDANQHKRRLLRAVTLGAAAAATTKVLPARWSRPVVDSAVLPAHAQATVIAGGEFAGGVTIAATHPHNPNLELAGLGDRLLQTVVPTARAQTLDSLNLYIRTASDTTVDVLAVVVFTDPGDNVNEWVFRRNGVSLNESTTIPFAGGLNEPACSGDELQITVTSIGATADGDVTVSIMVGGSGSPTAFSLSPGIFPSVTAQECTGR
jgi:hypothetical protein